MNQALPRFPLNYGRLSGPLLSRFRTLCCVESSLVADLVFHLGIFLTVQGCSRLVVRGVGRKIAMVETVTAVLGLVSAGIFLAHAFDGYRSRA